MGRRTLFRPVEFFHTPTISSLQRFPKPFCNELCSLYLQPPKVPRTFGVSTKSKLKDDIDNKWCLLII
ncbi:hypothetical protein EI995_02850 [Streptococcus suis]|nr:hypothetical protein [Streptococcus suis]RRR58956.1 hypothetical protein EI995_02850 [Streptococcus suis]RRR63904.1 hypothetical protein EI993_04905 [Streptococcus suis]